MVIALARRRWTTAGRRLHRASRSSRNRLLGNFMLAAFGMMAILHWQYSASDLLVQQEEQVSGRRELAEFFKTRPQQCAGVEQWWAAPFFGVTFFSFVGLAVITDEYFEPTLALISEDLGLSPDVAGATFMAIGSSAPELLTSVVDAFISKASVGVGTILGSAMFNLLVIVGGSALIGKSKDGGPLLIQAWPLSRDSFFYLLSIGVLAGVMLNDGDENPGLCVMADDTFDIFNNRTDQQDKDVFCYVGLVTTLEGLLLVLFYVCYIIFMANNRALETWYNENIAFWLCGKLGCPTKKTKPASKHADDLQRKIEEAKDRHREDSLDWGESEEAAAPRIENAGSIDEGFEMPEEAEFPGNPFTSGCPGSVGGAVYFFVAFPFYVLYFFTFPTFLPAGGLRNALLFFVNIVWITGLTLVMVYFATFGGCLLEIDPFIIGVVILAIGTSVPDALASFIVARDGHGDMAISNALGSNVFDILLGLGLPWFLSGLSFPGQVNAPEGPRDGQFVVTNGLGWGLAMLVFGLFLFVGSLVLFSWKMQKPIALILILYYGIFLLLIILANRCQLPICIELDCSRCDVEPGIF